MGGEESLVLQFIHEREKEKKGRNRQQRKVRAKRGRKKRQKRSEEKQSGTLQQGGGGGKRRNHLHKYRGKKGGGKLVKPLTESAIAGGGRLNASNLNLSCKKAWGKKGTRKKRYIRWKQNRGGGEEKKEIGGIWGRGTSVWGPSRRPSAGRRGDGRESIQEKSSVYWSRKKK